MTAPGRALQGCLVSGGLLAAMACSSSSSGTAPAAPPPATKTVATLRIIAGAGTTDTVDAQPAQALVVEVRDTLGQLATGATVRFTGIVASPLIGYGVEMSVGELTSSSYGPFASVTADAQGRAYVVVKYGPKAGPARLAITVPAFGLADSARYTVLPGGAAGWTFIPRDTAVVVGSNAVFSSHPLDRYGNPLPQSLPIVAVGQGIAVTGTGTVSTTAIGRFHLASRISATQTDTVSLSVVPTGTLAAYGTIPPGGDGLFITGFDGSGLRRVAFVSSDWGAPPAWTPDGNALIFVSGPGSVAPGSTLLSYPLSGGSAFPVLANSLTPSDQSWPVFSSTGGRLYFDAYPTLGLRQVFEAGASVGVDPPTVLPGIATITAIRPSPSPDGSRVAVVDATGASVVRIIDVQSGALLPFSVAGHTPRYSPNGNLIAFTTQYGGPLRVMNADGSNIHTVSPPGTAYSELGYDWSPDGRYLLAYNVVSSRLDLIDVSAQTAIPLTTITGLFWAAWKR